MGVTAVVLWLSSGRLEKVNAPICYQESTNFPGRSVDVYDLGPSDRSAYSDSEFSGQIENRFLDSFDERPFDKQTLTNGKAYPDLAQADEIYRFFWLPTFHNPPVVRVHQLRGERFLVAKMTDGKSGYDSGNLISTVSKKLTDEEWCELLALLEKAQFWQKEKINPHYLAQDGSFWILEGVKSGSKDRRYYVAGEQSPDEGPFRDACVYMMRLSGLPIDGDGEDFY